MMTRALRHATPNRSRARLHAALISGLVIMASPTKADDLQFTKAREALTFYDERPLFAPARRADAPAPTAEITPQVAAPQFNATLLGVIATGDGNGLALLRMGDSGETLRVHVGDSIAGWQLDKIDAHQAVFSSGGETTILTFPKLGPDAAQSPDGSADDKDSPTVPDNPTVPRQDIGIPSAQ